ncbi:MAG: cellulase family glycosylhydrolase [Verrucomicrobiota bacterium]
MPTYLCLQARPGFAGARRLMLRVAALATFAGLVATTHAQSLDEPFGGTALDTSRWAAGSTGSTGVIAVGGGQLTLDVNRTTSGRAALLTNAHAFNPFAQPLTIELQGISLAGVGNGTSSVAAYAVIGRIASDTGGAASPTLARNYVTGGGGHNGGGALGLSLLYYGGALPWRLQVIDSGTTYTATYFHLNGPPSAISWTVDGAASTYTVVLGGATFASTPSGSTITAGGTTATVPFTRFTAAGLNSGGTIVSRVAVGAANNNTVVDKAVVTLDAVHIGPASAPPPPAAQLPWMLGVNLASACFGEYYPGVHGTHYIWPGADDLDYFKARGMELIRLPFRWENIQPVLFGPLNSAEVARLDAFLDAAEERGMRVIPDVHNFGRYHINHVPQILGSPQVPRTAFADLWDKLAAHLKDRTCIWAYGIMNEPNNMAGHTWKTSAQVAIDAIRAHDTRTAILVPGDAYSNAHTWVGHSGDLHTLVDPSDNLIFEAHQYLDADHGGTGDADYDVDGVTPTTGVFRLQNFINWCETNDVRGFIGEFGVPDNDPRWSVALENMVAYMKANNLPGTYWAAGPRWGDYQQRCNIRPNHDEAPQMQAMTPHAPGPGTGYWPPFTWYEDSVTTGTTGSYSYHYKSGAASLAADFADPAAKYSGEHGISLAYAVPPGGWAGGGLHINGGVNLAGNHAKAQVLSLRARSGTGGSVRVFLVTDAGLNSAKIDLASITPLTAAWQQIRIPLPAFVNANYDGTQRVQRVAFEGLPVNNTAHVVHLDHFVFERPEAVAPAVAVAVNGGTTTLPAGASITANATATDSQSAIDFIEFRLNGDRVGIATTAPWTSTFNLGDPGTHTLTAVAFDIHGNAAESTPVTLTATP